MIRWDRVKPYGVGGWLWWLSVFWAGIGACISALIFLGSFQPITASGDVIPAWLGGDGAVNVIWDSESAAIVVWLVLAIPVLVAGRVRLRAWGQGRTLWAGAWVVGLPLMVLTRVCADTLPSVTRCSAEIGGCAQYPYYGPALVNWSELAICVAFVATIAVMTTVLRRSQTIAQPGRTRRPNPGL